MFVTYEILTYLSIRLMKKRKRKSFGGNNDRVWRKPELPLHPESPTGVVWSNHIEEKEEILV